jgi:hypothetical protein
MKVKVYIVTDGMYSDYGIKAVFSDKTAADYSFNNVEEG